MKTDDYLNNFIFRYVDLFQYIHPNYITFIGFFFNIMIFLLTEKNIWLFCLFNFLRVLCDSLDGMIARKFNKCSLIGGYLDTLCDMSHIFIILDFILKDFFNIFHCIIIIITLISIMILYLFKLNALSNHDNLYNRSEFNFIDIVPVFIAQNTYTSIISVNIYFILKNKIDFKYFVSNILYLN